MTRFQPSGIAPNLAAVTLWATRTAESRLTTKTNEQLQTTCRDRKGSGGAACGGRLLLLDQAGFDESSEERMRIVRLALKLRVILAA